METITPSTVTKTTERVFGGNVINFAQFIMTIIEVYWYSHHATT